MMTSHSKIMNQIEEEDLVLNEDEPQICLTKEECIALLKECQHSWISYENPIARAVIRKIMDFIDER